MQIRTLLLQHLPLHVLIHLVCAMSGSALHVLSNSADASSSTLTSEVRQLICDEPHFCLQDGRPAVGAEAAVASSCQTILRKFARHLLLQQVALDAAPQRRLRGCKLVSLDLQSCNLL